MKKFAKRSMAVMMAVVMFALIIHVPAEAATLWSEWGGGEDIVVQGGTFDFYIDIANVYSYQKVCMEIYNSYGTKVLSSEWDETYTPSYEDGSGWYWESGYWYTGDLPVGTYTMKWYIKYWSNSAWHSTGYLASHSMKIISASTYGWISHDGSWYYRQPNGVFAEGFKSIDGYNYYFSENIYTENRMVTSDMMYVTADNCLYYFGADGRGCSQWVDIGLGDWVYFGNDGKAYDGWVKSGGSWYYIIDGWMQRDMWISGSGVNEWCYVKDNGVMATGWLSMGDGWHLFDSNGYEKHGWAQDGGKWYFFTESGYMLTGWQQIAGKWYYFGNAMATGWKQISGTWYYFGSDGAMKTNWQKVDGSWYYFGSDGAMRSGWQKIDGVWYYFNNTMATGWKMIDGTWYYFKSSGAMASGESIKIDGIYYTFASNGAWVH